MNEKTFRKMYTQEEIKAIANDSVVTSKTGCRRMWTEEEIKAIAGSVAPPSPTGENRLGLFINDTLTEIKSTDFVPDQTTISGDIFQNKNGLEKIIFPDTILTITSNIIIGSENITYIEIGKDIQRIYTLSTTSNKQNLVIKFRGTTPPYISSETGLTSNSDLKAIYVPKESLSTYKKANGFKQFANKIVGY